MRIGFDNDKYIALQAEHIRNRINQFGGKLYLEFGGKLFDDFHASRVLPGFAPDSKIRMLKQLVDDVEMIVAINANDIEKSKMRGDLGITYDEDVLRLLDIFTSMGFASAGVVITRLRHHLPRSPSASDSPHSASSPTLVTRHAGYPYDTSRIVSEEGYGKNQYVESPRYPLVVVTGPGPGSGKIWPPACRRCTTSISAASQRDTRNTRPSPSGTCPSSIPSTSPTRPRRSISTTQTPSTRSISRPTGRPPSTTTAMSRSSPSSKRCSSASSGKAPAQFPTDMGVNMAGKAIVDDEAVRDAAKMEIVRRYFQAAVDARRLGTGSEHVEKLELLMKQAGVDTSYSPARSAALLKEETTRGARWGARPTRRLSRDGKDADLLGAASSLLMNVTQGRRGSR